MGQRVIHGSRGNQYVFHPRKIPDIVQIVSHDGGLPGFSALTTFLPADGLGIVVLVNGNEKHAEIDEIMNKIYESVLGFVKTLGRSRWVFGLLSD
jgi:hypothetical protein